MIELTVNGRRAELPEGTCVEALVDSLGICRIGIAVALNGSVVPRGGWTTTPVSAGDVVEILSPAQGG